MGLTIHYGLTANTRSKAKALKMIQALRQRCLDLPFETVGDILDLSGPECDWTKRDKDDPLRWFLIQSDTSVDYVWKRTWDAKKGLSTMRAVKPGENDPSRYSMGVLPLHVIGFTAWPGEGCEQSNVGLCLYPATVEVEQYGYTDTIRTGCKGWTWPSPFSMVPTGKTARCRAFSSSWTSPMWGRAWPRPPWGWTRPS